jgi:Ca2+-binding EF-hand superfamily protein
MKKLGMKVKKKEISAMIKGVDLDGNGTVEVRSTLFYS